MSKKHTSTRTAKRGLRSLDQAQLGTIAGGDKDGCYLVFVGTTVTPPPSPTPSNPQPPIVINLDLVLVCP